MRSGLFGKKLRRGEQDFYLQITSLIDTLVIILVFMLMTLGSGNLEPAAGVNLPWSTQGAELAQGLKLVAKVDGIYVEEEKIMALDKAIVPSGVTTEDNRKIVPLFQKLSEKARESKKAAGNSVKFEGKILFQADKGVPLKTVKQVLYTAARAGYNDFKFAVIRQ